MTTTIWVIVTAIASFIVLGLCYGIEDAVIESYQKAQVTGALTAEQIILFTFLGCLCALPIGILLHVIDRPWWLVVLSVLFFTYMLIGVAVDDAEEYARKEWRRRKEYQTQQRLRMAATTERAMREISTIASDTVSSFRSATRGGSSEYWRGSGNRLKTTNGGSAFRPMGPLRRK